MSNTLALIKMIASGAIFAAAIDERCSQMVELLPSLDRVGREIDQEDAAITQLGQRQLLFEPLAGAAEHHSGHFSEQRVI
jgi:hypothetical protein